jgi:hypothetical protein
MAVENGVILNLDRLEEMMRKTQEIASTQVLVGIPAARSPRQGDPIGNAALGYIAEFGSPARNIPPRPWLGPPVNRMRDEAAAMLKKAAELRFDGKAAEADQVLNALGLMAQNKVKQNITSGGDPKFADWADSTKERRGVAGQSSTLPSGEKNPNYTILVDSGQMLNSISYVLRRKGK